MRDKQSLATRSAQRFCLTYRKELEPQSQSGQVKPGYYKTRNTEINEYCDCSEEEELKAFCVSVRKQKE